MATPNYYYGTGRRKTSVARVFLKSGSGKIVVNGKPLDEFFSRETGRMVVRWQGGIVADLPVQPVSGASPVYDRVINLAFRRLGFTGEEVPPNDGNLFEPAHDWQQPEGGWRNTTARRAAVGIAATAAAAGAVVAGTRNR